MNIVGNTLIGIGMFALIFGTSMAEPMDDSAFFFQIACYRRHMCRHHRRHCPHNG